MTKFLVPQGSTFYCFIIIFYMAFALHVGFVRYRFRKHFKILTGNFIIDILASMFSFPNVLVQMEETARYLLRPSRRRCVLLWGKKRKSIICANITK